MATDLFPFSLFIHFFKIFCLFFVYYLFEKRKKKARKSYFFPVWVMEFSITSLCLDKVKVFSNLTWQSS